LLRILFGIFLIVHGLVHSAIWLSAPKTNGPFNAGHSWFFNLLGLQGGPERTFAIIFSLIATLTLIIGGISLLSHQSWFQLPLIIGASVSLLLIVAYFNPWMSLAILLDIGVIYLVAFRHWPAI
jgi:hypothetical protein